MLKLFLILETIPLALVSLTAPMFFFWIQAFENHNKKVPLSIFHDKLLNTMAAAIPFVAIAVIIAAWWFYSHNQKNYAIAAMIFPIVYFIVLKTLSPN